MRVDIAKILATTSFKNVLDVLEDDALDRAMINLTELVGTISLEVSHKTSSKVVLNLDHMAGHLAVRSSNNLLGKG